MMKCSWFPNVDIVYSKYLMIGVLGLSVIGCGFHLRAPIPIPAAFQTLRILPDQPFEPLQLALRQTLKSAGIRVVDVSAPIETQASILTIRSQYFSERTTAYGPDVQINRATLQYVVTYNITDCAGKILIPNNTIQVERELTINPNAVLGTEFERDKVKSELYGDATLQLIRQISIHHANPS